MNLEQLLAALANADALAQQGDERAAQDARQLAQLVRQAQSAQTAEEPSTAEDVSDFERLAAQAGAGSQVGIAQMLGFPVDVVASALSGVGELTGLYGPIEAPIGGSEFFDVMMRPIRANVPEPTTSGERIARRVGQEVGAAATGLPLAFAAPAVRAAPVATAAVEGGAALGAGLGAGLLSEQFPDSQIADISGALLGGLTAGGVGGRIAGLGDTAAVVRPGIEEQRAIASDAYSQVRADTRTLSQPMAQSLADRVANRMANERLSARSSPAAANVLQAILEDTQVPLRLEDVEQLRRLTTDSIPATASKTERRLGQIMKQEITDFLNELDDPIADLLVEGRTAARRGSAAADVERATDRAVLRAASTGSGGNEINAIRQNLRRIIETPRLSRSFTADELAAMRQIVEGTADQNVMRRLSRIAPTSGGLAAMLGIGGTLASPEVAIPIMGLAEGARYLGERSTRGSIQGLLQSLAPDRVLTPGQQGATSVLRGLLSARTAAQND